MLGLQEQVYRRVCPPGGTLGRLSEEIYREVAYIAYHFHWSKRDIMDMTHRERRKWVSEIAGLNVQINENNERSYRERMENILTERKE
jgi:hypothetical protein